MRRIVSAFVLAALAALVPVVAPDPAAAAAPITGRIVEYTSGNPAPGTTVRLHEDDGGAPGAVVQTAVAGDNGEFSVVPPTADDYWVEVVRNRFVQGGYVQDRPTGPSWVQYDAEFAAPVAPGTSLGRVNGVPSFVSGFVVNAATGARVRGIVVGMRDAADRSIVVGSDTTDSNGFYRIPIWGEDFGMRVNGTSRGFERGWRACNGNVVPTWGAACASPIGRAPNTRIDRR